MNERHALKRFQEVAADHEMTILHDDGLYRHVRFRSPETWVFGYDLTTWPGHLALNGDLVSGYTFARVDDMMHFFAKPDINPGYWSEKITNEAARQATRVYSEARLHVLVAERLKDYPPEAHAAWRAHLALRDTSFETGAHLALRDFDWSPYPFGDYWEWNLREWDHIFLMCCFAICAGANRYLGR